MGSRCPTLPVIHHPLPVTRCSSPSAPIPLPVIHPLQPLAPPHLAHCFLVFIAVILRILHPHSILSFCHHHHLCLLHFFIVLLAFSPSFSPSRCPRLVIIFHALPPSFMPFCCPCWPRLLRHLLPHMLQF